MKFLRNGRKNQIKQLTDLHIHNILKLLTTRYLFLYKSKKIAHFDTLSPLQQLSILYLLKIQINSC